MTELDKFKRRLVRSVSHLQKQEQEPQDAAWEQMRKETGCDCKLLWERMRALTIKKLKRLVAADDRSENIAAVARLSVTDWLLFDLVLVHEKVDVIGRDQIGRGKGQTERPTMIELFDLVLEYDIESKKGEQLLEAWAALTREYNSSGRHCSPMLLQKRWFQLKEMTRANFYKLWNNYRGNQKLWEAAQLCKPTPLQAEIAKRFPNVITRPFPEWQELIRMERVILLEQFETQNRLKYGPETVDDKPDLEMIEPEIETIDLGAESDGEHANTSNKARPSAIEEVNLALVKQEVVNDCIMIKEEPVEDGLSNVQILETTHIPTGLNEDTDSSSHLSSLALDEANRENLTRQMSNFMKTSTLEDVSVSKTVMQHEATDADYPDIPDELIKQKADEYFKSKTKLVEPETKETPDVNADGDDDKNDDLVDDIIKQKADDFVRKVDIKKLVNDVVDEFKLPEELSFADEGIEFVDDGIECDEDDDDTSEKKIEEEVPGPVIKAEVNEEDEDKVEKDENTFKVKDVNSSSSEEEDAHSPKFDLKLLMEPVVYTTKLDDMIIFKGKKFNFVQFQNVIDSVVIESKPVSNRAIKVEVEDCDDIFDQSNLSQSSKAASDDLFQNDCSSQPQSNECKDTTDILLNDNLITKKTAVLNDDAFMNDSHEPSNDSDESEEEIDESLKVKATSCLLQKPRNRVYNPINLCKNPDFNTRLKRLTAGFFSSVRNRKLLSACKPMTIDLHKAFECKLVNGSLYLKCSEGNSQPVTGQIDNAQASSVIPSAMPVQSLFSKEKTNVNISDLISSTQIDTVDLTQRSKTINLRDLSEIRRINQHLLTAQVPPMRVDSLDVKKSPTEQPQHDVIQEVAEDTKPIDDSDEHKIVGVISRPDVSQNTLAPEHDFREDRPVDRMPRSFRGRTRGAMRGGPAKKYGPAKPYVPPFTSTKPTIAPWRIGPKPKPTNLDDFLITIDTLNRMINKLDGSDEYKNPKGKNKRPIWSIGKNIRESLAIPVDFINSIPNDDPATAETEETAVASEVNNVTNLSAENSPDVAVDVSVQTIDTEPKQSLKEVKKPREKEDKRKRKRTTKYCCWAKEKMVKFCTNYKMITTHLCPSVCECCCRQDFIDEMKRRQVFKKGLKAQSSNEDTIVLSDEEYDDNTATDDSNDVRIPGFDPAEDTPPVPKVRVSSQYKAVRRNCKGRGVPMNVAGVSAMPAPGVVGQQPVMRINVSYIPAAPEHPPPVSTRTSSGFPQSLLEQITAGASPNQAIGTPLLALSSSPNRVNIPVALQQPTINTMQRQIVIDASEAPVAAEKVQDRMFYLNSKSISDKPKDSPIFLGKNKILLTNVKFPTNFNGEVTNAPLPPATITPTLPLPPGVQLILLPDGQLKFTLDSSIQLDEAQLNALPKIISAVQQQINCQMIAPAAENASSEITSAISSIVSSTIVESGDEIISLVNQEVPEKQTTETELSIQNSIDVPLNIVEGGDEIGSLMNQEVLEKQTTETVQSIQDSIGENLKEQSEHINQADIINNTSQESGKAGKNTSISEGPTAVESSSNYANSTNDTNKPNDSKTIEEYKNPEKINASTDNSLNVNDAVNEGASCSRNLLSDLMEMSGISSDDVPQESPEKAQIAMPVVASSSVPLLNTLTTAPPFETIARSSQLQSTQLVTANTELVDAPQTLPELSPITSLAELKYACDNNGLFYKLDLDTGVLAPINVCIKKNTKPKPRFIRNNPRSVLTTKSVIDLTDDLETESAKNVLKDGTVKPIKLLKRVVYKPPNLLRKSNAHKEVLTNPQTVSNLKSRKRKQSMEKIEARIDLVDSDAPMEEEYLVDSSDSDGEEKIPSKRKEIPIPDIASEDSSDEEPLSKKFMRLKQLNSTQVREKDDNLSVSTLKNTVGPEDKDATEAFIEATSVHDPPIDVPVPIGPAKETELDTENAVPMNLDDMDTSENVIDNLNPEDMEIVEPQFMPLLGESESQEEDCILGF